MSVRDYHFIRDNVQYSGKKTKTINKLYQNKTDVISTPEPKPRRGRKFKLASGKVIPNVYYACDVFRVHIWSVRPSQGWQTMWIGHLRWLTGKPRNLTVIWLTIKHETVGREQSWGHARQDTAACVPLYFEPAAFKFGCPTLLWTGICMRPHFYFKPTAFANP